MSTQTVSVGPSRPPPQKPSARRFRGRLLVLAPLALIAVAASLVFVSYNVRRALIGDQTICTVTTESQRYDESLSDAEGTVYSGGDHPLNPSVGDQYVGYSGCNPAETSCVRTIEPLGTRLDC
jgi:hypothetical protein